MAEIFKSECPDNKPYKELNEIKIPNENLKKYVGKYEVNSEYSIPISCNNNQLFAQINEEPKFEIFAQNL